MSFKILLQVIFILTASNITRANDSLPVSYYHITNWEVESVFENTAIRDIVFDDKNQLLVATNQGLMKFNGMKFLDAKVKGFDKNNAVLMQLETNKNNLWGVYENGLFESIKSEVINFNKKIQYNSITRFTITNDGLPWFISDFKIYRVDENNIISSIDQTSKATVIKKSVKGDTILVGLDGRIIRLDLTGQVIEQKSLNNSSIIIRNIIESKDGSVWVATSDGIYIFSENLNKIDNFNNNYNVKDIYEDSNGIMWIGTQKGMFIYEDNRLKSINLKHNNNLRVTGIAEDADGNIWFSTWSNGLFRVKPTLFDTYIGNISGSTVYKQTSNKSQWFGGYSGLYLDLGGGIKPLSSSGLKSQAIFDIEEGIKNEVWVAYLFDLIIFDHKGEKIKSVLDIDTLKYYFLHKDSEDIMWVGTSTGLYTKDLKSPEAFTKFTLPENSQVKKILQLDDNQLLIVTTNHAYIYTNKTLIENQITQIFNVADDLRVVTFDSSSQTLWYYNPVKHKLIKFKNNVTTEYLLDMVLKNFHFYSMTVNETGDLIILGESGVVHILAEWFSEYENSKQPYKALFYKILAIPNHRKSECNYGNRSISRDSDNRIYLSCQSGIFRLNKAKIKNNKQAKNNSKVEVTDVTSDGGGESFKNGTHLFTPETKSYSIYFSGQSINDLMPLRYRYKLIGLEDKWTEPKDNFSVIYAKLNPGDYEFEVQGKTTYSSWNTDEFGRFKFTVRPHYYQTNLFIGLVALSFLLVIIFAFYFFDYFRIVFYKNKAIKLGELVEEKTQSLKKIQARELENEKLSKILLKKEVEKTTKELTHQMQLTLEKEKQLHESQKMEVVGQLTSGIAHDFNNMLSIIFIGSDVIIDSLKKSNEDQSINLRWLEKVLATSRNCKEVINQLMQFTRKSDESSQIINVNESLVDIIQLIKVGIPETLKFDINLMDIDVDINANLGRFNQIILNLIINARDACNNYGKIIISTSTIYHENKCICASCHKEFKGDYVEIEVKDDGSGILATLQPKIFSPFFSGKNNQANSGLGLHVIHSNVHHLGGHILLDSKESKGTSFKVLLPMAESQLYFLAPIEEADKRPVLDNEINLLLVEDSASLVDLIRYLLEENNISVDVAQDGAEGLELFNNNPDKYDLILTDNSMPRMTGVEMSEKILECKQGTKIILLTGDVNDEIINQSHKIGINEVVLKPIDADELINTVFNSITKESLDEHYEGKNND